MKQCPHCTEKMPDTYIICTACHKELVPPQMPSYHPSSGGSYDARIPLVLRKRNELGWGKWIQIFLGTIVYLAVFLGPLIQQGNVQIPWSRHLSGAAGQEGKLFLTGDQAILVAKTKDELLAVRGAGDSIKQKTQKSVAGSKGAVSRRLSNKLARVPAGSAVRVLDTADGVCRVIVLDGQYEGTLGWVDSAHIASFSRQEGQ